MTSKAWFVGNGPSLSIERLNEDVHPAFACNRIQVAYETTEWRPDYYIFTDRFGNPGWQKELLKHIERRYLCFVRGDMLPWIDRWWEHNNLRILPECDRLDEPHPWHKPFCTYGGPLNIAAQLTVAMDFDELHLMGCDAVYFWDERQNHFHKDYLKEGIRYNREKAERATTTLNYVHDLIRTEFQKRGKTIHA
jgi:hypothetical protein